MQGPPLRNFDRNEGCVLFLGFIVADMAGRLALIIEAITEFERLLTEQQRVLGADHPATLATRNNLAFWRGRGGHVADDPSV